MSATLDPASDLIAIDRVKKLLTEYHWDDIGDLDTRTSSGYYKPVFQCRDWKALVGKLWTTIWRQENGLCVDMASHKTADIERIEFELRKIAGLTLTGKS